MERPAVSRGPGVHQARFYQLEDSGWIRCELCPKLCRIREGGRGFCRVRVRGNDTLYVTNFGVCAASAMDPIEKKPLYHFFPGHSILSLGTVGCNMGCVFCQNWQISQADPDAFYVEPGDVVAAAAGQAHDGCIGVAYTYSEPVIWFEFVLETAALVREAGLQNVMVTNGFISEEPLKELLGLVDGFNVDLKGFSPEFYVRLCKGLRDPVLRTMELIHDAGRHLEVTNLIIPGYNDDPRELEALAAWLAGLNPEIPLHLSRYFPSYKLRAEPTPVKTMLKSRDVALEHLKFVYLGNVQERGTGDTRCPRCQESVIERHDYGLRLSGLTKDDRCVSCGHKIPITGPARERPIDL